MRSKLFLLLLLSLSLGALTHAQNRLVAVTYDQMMTPTDQFNAVFEDYPNDIDQDQYRPILMKVAKVCRDVEFICLDYKTVDPDGKEVVASGLLCLPKGRIKGVINVTPFCREKKWAGTVRKWTLECIPSMRGYALLVPDTIGYGTTADEIVALLMCENAALVSVHFRQAVEEYLASLEKPRKLPTKTLFFGYSLGAAGALATAKYYHAHPELNIKQHILYLGSGAYEPLVAIESSINAGESDYMLYPAISKSLNRWKHMNLDYNQLFHGPVLDDFDFVSGCNTDMTELTKVYGKDLHGYLHPDFFTEEKNPEINRVIDTLKTLKVSVDRKSLPRNMKIYLRHSEEDRYVPIECTDSLRKELRKAGYSNVKYMRDAHGNHYDEGGRSVIDVFLLDF